MIFKSIFNILFFFYASKIFCLTIAEPVNLTSFLPTNQVREDEFYVPCTGKNCGPDYPGRPSPVNSRLPRLPYPQNLLQPPFCYSDADCAFSFENASDGICKHRPNKVLPSICDCRETKRIKLNGSGRPGVHICEKWTCKKFEDCQYSKTQAPWHFKVTGIYSGMLCSKSKYCKCDYHHVTTNRGCVQLGDENQKCFNLTD